MIKKMTLLAMAVAALAAFAAPSMASAAQLTQPAGTLVKVGTTVVGTSTNTVTHVGGLTLECALVTVNGIVAKNTGGKAGVGEVEIKMDEPSADSTKTCKIVGVGAVTIDPTLTNILAKSGATSGTASFDFNVTGLCEAHSTTSKVTWSGTDVIHIEAGVGGTCGENGTLTGDFTLETTAGVGIIAES